MWQLTIEDDEGQRTSLDLNLEEYTVGRAEDNDIRLTERNVSRKHAMLRITVDGWELLDEGSYNGTYVNGERVGGDGAILAAGDVINIGDYRVELSDAAADQPPPDETGRTRRPDRLICVIGPVPGHEFPLQGDMLQVGRAEEADLSINHASVSRLHAELHNLGEGRWEVVDQGSSNGIRINGVELRRGIIEPGDALELGDVRLRFVALGKFYRPVVDMSQQLPAMPFEGMSTGVAPSSQRSVGAIAVVLLVMVALGIGGWAMFSGSGGAGPGPASSTPPMATSEEEARAYLDKATKYADDGDIEMAHNHLQRIPEESPVREDSTFQALEDQWADAQFKKAESVQDPAQKRAILERISEATSVSPAKRTRAAELVNEISEVEDLDKPVTPRPGAGNPTGGLTPNKASTAKPPPGKNAKEEIYDDDGGVEKFNANAHKRNLLNKMNSGSASKTELRMLIAICSGDGDKACRNSAYAKWKAMEDP